MQKTIVSLCALGTLLMAGCGIAKNGPLPQDVSSTAMTGTIFGGQQPIVGSTVTVWAMGTSGYGAGATQLASTTSGTGGTFTFAANAYTCPYSNTPVYITAAGGDQGGIANANIMLAAGVGACSTAKSATVNIDEVSTAVTAFALSHFFTTSLGGAATTDLIGGTAAGSGIYNAGMVEANAYTIPTLLNVGLGIVQANTATMTIEASKIYSIANTLAACVNSAGETSTTETTTACGKLFHDTTPPSGTRPLDTLQAAVQMALYPYQNVSALYLLGGSTPPFTGLSTTPNDWTVGVSYTSSSFGLGVNGSSTSHTSSSIDIDTNGNIWFPTNSSTSHGLAFFDPETGLFNGPYATTLSHPQYVTVDEQGHVFGDDLSAAHIAGVSTSSPGTVTSYATTGFTGPVTAGYGTSSVDAIAYTGGGTSSALGSTLYEELSGTISTLGTFLAPATSILAYVYVGPPDSLSVDAATSGSSTPCRYESISGGSRITTATSSSSNCYSGGIADTAFDPTYDNDGVMAATSTNQFCDYGYNYDNEDAEGTCFASPITLTAPEGIALDGDGHLWVANSGNSSVSTLGHTDAANHNYTSADYKATSTVQYIHNSTYGNTMTTPYGIAIDGGGNVWVSNAGCVSTTGSTCTPGSFVLSELVGAAAPTITPLAAQNNQTKPGYRPSASIGRLKTLDGQSLVGSAVHSGRGKLR